MHGWLGFADSSLHTAKHLATAEERALKGCLRDAKPGSSSGLAGVRLALQCYVRNAASVQLVFSQY